MKTVQIYTDGACSGNPGPGGWGAILVYNQHEKEISGGDKYTTNNKMELTAVVKALEILNEPCRVALYTDSKYIVDSVNNGWVYSWQKNKWRKSDGKPALNVDLWMRVLQLMEIHQVKFNWVKGHADNYYNNKCDQMAVAESRKFV